MNSLGGLLVKYFLNYQDDSMKRVVGRNYLRSAVVKLLFTS